MKKQILAACVAALSLSQIGCDERPAIQSRSPKAAVTRSQPELVVSTRPSVTPPVVAIVDAGGIVPEIEVDALAVSHEDGRTVDHLARAQSLRDQGDLEGALTEARRALFDAPGDVEVLHQIDRLTRLTGDKALRVVALERIAAIETTDAMPLIQKARVLITLKDYEGAIEVANDAVARDVNNPEGYQALGRAHLSRGELTAAITSFQKVVSLAPDHGYALNNLGLALLRANENEAAVTALARAAELLPNVAYVHNNLGVALEREQRFDEAKEAYARSSFLSPKYVKARVNAARVAALTLPSNDAVSTDVFDSEADLQTEVDEAPDFSEVEGTE